MKTTARLPPSSGLIPATLSTDLPPIACSSLDAGRECLCQNGDDPVSALEEMIEGRRKVCRNVSLYRKHEQMHVIYIVRYGYFKLIGDDSLGEHAIAGFPMAGDLLGFDAVATGRHQFRLTALADSEVCEIPFGKLVDRMAVDPEIQRIFLQKMSYSLMEEYGRSSLLSKTSLDERFATFIMNQGARFARLGYSDKSFRLIMARSDIGSFLGTTVESVSRVISRFNARGVVSINGRSVEVLDPLLLNAIANGGDLPYR